MKLLRRIYIFLKNALIIARKIESEKWPCIMTALDYMYCRLKFHVNSEEYIDFQFYNFKNRYRKNFLLKYHQKNKFKKINPNALITRSKYHFYQTIPDSFSRKVILAPICGVDAFIEFARQYKKIVTKPDTGSLGRDVTIFTYKDDEQAKEYFFGLSEVTICEEFIYQHEKMAEISPFSVNTIRIISFREQDDVKIISATLRTGGNINSIIDNLKKDGVGAQIDINTGTICTYGFDYNDNIYIKHPISGVQFLGFSIPNWDKVVELVKNSHRKIDGCQVLGWDIAVTETGADIVEANGRPGTPITQMLDTKPKGEIILRAIHEAEKKKNKK